MKKLFSLILAFVVVFAIGTTTFAASTADVAIVFKDGTTTVTELTVGKTYTMEMTFTSATAMKGANILYYLTNFDGDSFVFKSATNAGNPDLNSIDKSFPEYPYIILNLDSETNTLVATFDITPTAVGTAKIEIEKDSDTWSSYVCEASGNPIVINNVTGNEITVKAAGPVAQPVNLNKDVTTFTSDEGAEDNDLAYAYAIEVVPNAGTEKITDVIWAAGDKYTAPIDLRPYTNLVAGTIKIGFLSKEGLSNVGGLFKSDSETVSYYYTQNLADAVAAKAE